MKLRKIIRKRMYQYISLEFDRKRGKVIFTATHRNPSAQIYWHIDNDYITHTKFTHQLAISRPPVNMS